MMKTLKQVEYGVYSYVISIASVIIVFSDLGISWYSYNNSLQSRQKLELEKIISFKLALSLAVVFLFPLLFFKTEGLFILFFLVVTTFVISSFNRNILMIHRAKQNVLEDNLLILFEPTIRVLFMVVLVTSRRNFSVELVCLGYLLIGIATLVLNYFISRGLRLNIQYFKIAEIWGLLKKTTPFFLYYFFHVSIVRMDTIFLEKFADLNAVAQYNASFTILFTIVMVLSAAISSNFNKVLRQTPFKTAMLVILVSVLIILITQLFSGYIFNQILPQEYALSSNIINILVLSIPFTTAHFWLTIKNNFQNNTRANIICYSSVFFIKLITLALLKFEDPLVFSKTYVLFEGITLILMIALTKRTK